MNVGYREDGGNGGEHMRGYQNDTSAQLALNQAITKCASCFDVLQLLAEANVTPSTANMATAMHRIASTGASQPDMVMKDQRFRQLVLNVEERLDKTPRDFGEQHLANVVWGAAKLRLQRKPLFTLVQKEVLSERRRLSEFSPQQLAAIAWSYAMMGFDAPYLFEAVQEEAVRQPVLARMLEQAGLLRRSESQLAGDRARWTGGGLGGGAGAGAQGQMHAGQQGGQGGLQWSQAGIVPQQMQGGVGMGGMGAFGAGAAAAGPWGAVGEGGGGAGGGGYSGFSPNLNPKAPGQAVAPMGSGMLSGNNNGGLPAQGFPAAPSRPAAGAVGHHSQGAASAAPAQDGLPGRPITPEQSKADMAAAAEQHKKEMEEKQRQVLGDEDGGATCPLCIEEMDSTDMSFLPCPCGYQICLLCFNHIQNEGNKQCPACRTEYNEEKFRQQAPPERKKKAEEADKDKDAAKADKDAGWETGGSKKKAGQKKPNPLTFPGFAPKVAEMLLQCHEQGIVTRGELDERVMEDLKALPERVLSEFMKKDMSRIRNKSAFLNGIICRVQEELQSDRSTSTLGDKVGGHIGGSYLLGQHHQFATQEQRPRAHSDEGTRGTGPIGPGTGSVGGGGGGGSGGSGGGGSLAHGHGVPGRGGIHNGGAGWSRTEDDLLGAAQGLGSLHLGGAGGMGASGAGGMGTGGAGAIGGGGGGGGMGAGPIGGLSRDVTPEQQELARQQVEQFLLQHQAQQQAQLQVPPVQGGLGGFHPMQGGLGNVLAFGESRPATGASSMSLLHQMQMRGDSEAGAAAGSRLLAMLQGGGGEAGQGGWGGGEDRPEKPPLFMRMNGGDGRGPHGLGGGGVLGDGGQADQRRYDGGLKGLGGGDEEGLAFLPVGDEGGGAMGRCFQCGREKLGDLDQSDGNFYCNACWGAFEVHHAPGRLPRNV